MNPASKDKVTAHLDKNIISSIISTARASVKEPSRPFTPSDSQRTLFSNSDLARPPSSYSIKTFAKELEPLKQRPVILEPVIQTGRKVMSEDIKNPPRKPVKVIYGIPEEQYQEEDDENPTISEARDIIKTIDKIRSDTEYRNDFKNEDLQILLDNITDILAELKYSPNVPVWISRKEILKSLAFTLEYYEKDTIKIMKICKNILENVTSHDMLYRKKKKSVVTNPLALGAIKSLYQLTKCSDNDRVFEEEELIDTFYDVLLSIVSEDSYTQIGLPYEFMLYLLGSVKNITNNEEIALESCRFLSLLMPLLPTPGIDESPHPNPKHVDLLIQVSGIIKNLSNSKSLETIMELQILEKLILMIQIYNKGEILLNCLKAITKLSPEDIVNAILRPSIRTFFNIFIDSSNTLVLSRTCYILANILGVYNTEDDIAELYNIENLLYIWEENIGNTDEMSVDLLIKIIRLMANILKAKHIGLKFKPFEEVLKLLLDTLSCYKTEIYEELVLNTVACMANLLFYDLPDLDFINEHNRLVAFSKISSMVVNCNNEEIAVQALRTLANLTRHESICKELPRLFMIDALLMLLNNFCWDIVYFSLGCFINISGITKELLYSERVFDSLINFLEEVYNTEFEFSGQLCMIFCNLCYLSKGLVPWESVAGEENVKKLSDMVKEILDLKGGDEKMAKAVEIAKDLNEFMPKPLLPCMAEGCGRKFQNKELLQDHWDRRHK
ncbi:hypothetical protein SteCoe_18661 [Stentor coeruleus]|uniref:C2H2-type domain-containing protein n=1 Tax=Stentor coeruleus TaxID=5963 RepID=A0A1R2BWI7_9CILI|nr:hypothetical protein SteCoe_18661 [Stentor coeruleus]